MEKKDKHKNQTKQTQQSNKKAIAIRYDGSNAPAVTMQELQAINKKVEELGWK